MADMNAKIVHSSLGGGYWGEVSVWGDSGGEVTIRGPVTSAREGTENTQTVSLGTVPSGGNLFVRFNLPPIPGKYIVRYRETADHTLDVSEQEASAPAGDMGFGWNGRIVRLDWPSGTSQTAQQDYNPNPETIDPADYGMIVNADTPSGVALAPSAIRDGITADPSGTEVNLSDGRTVTVYPREERDEAVRSPETGDPIDSPVGSGGVEGGVGSGSSSGGSSGLLGAVGAGALLLVAAGYALLGGGDGGD